MEQRKFGNITLIEGKNNGRYPFANTLLIEDSVRVLVDPAAGRRKMKGVLERGGVDVIINTHYHEDHVTYNYLFPEAEVCFHEADRRGFESVEGMLEMGVGNRLPPEMKRQYAEIYTDRFHFLGWEPARLLEDGEELRFGDTRTVVVHLPGHTPGHIGLFFPDQELLFSTDIDLTPFGPWYGDATGDIDAYVDSIKKVRDFDAKFVITSHEGPVYEDFREKAAAYLGTIEKREGRVLENISEPATLDELAKRWIIYGKPRSPEDMYLIGEGAMIEKHLERLLRAGKAVHEGDKYVAV